MIYRKATFNDIESIFTLVNDYASDGIMLARSRNTLYETLRDMIVAVDETTNDVVGVGGLHIVWDRMAEVRTMAISPAHTRRGIGAEIVKRLLAEGRALGVTMFFTPLSSKSARLTRNSSWSKSSRSAESAIAMWSSSASRRHAP